VQCHAEQGKDALVSHWLPIFLCFFCCTVTSRSLTSAVGLVLRIVLFRSSSALFPVLWVHFLTPETDFVSCSASWLYETTPSLPCGMAAVPGGPAEQRTLLWFLSEAHSLSGDIPFLRSTSVPTAHMTSLSPSPLLKQEPYSGYQIPSQSFPPAEQPRSLSLSSYRRCSRPCIIFVALHWTPFGRFLSFWNCGAQNQTRYSKYPSSTVPVGQSSPGQVLA